MNNKTDRLSLPKICQGLQSISKLEFYHHCVQPDFNIVLLCLFRIHSLPFQKEPYWLFSLQGLFILQLLCLMVINIWIFMVLISILYLKKHCQILIFVNLSFEVLAQYGMQRVMLMTPSQVLSRIAQMQLVHLVMTSPFARKEAASMGYRMTSRYNHFKSYPFFYTNQFLEKTKYLIAPEYRDDHVCMTMFV